MKKAAKWLCILCLPVLLLAGSIGLTVNSLWLYEHGAREYGVGDDLARYGLELSGPELEAVYAGLISYFNSGEDYVNITVTRDGEPFSLFTQEETIHFRDVKGLIRLDYGLLAGTLAYVLAFAGISLLWWRDRRRLAQSLAGGGGLTLGLLLVLVLINTLFGFGQIFYRFHLLFFSNDFWAAEGYMLRLFPIEFFVDAVAFGAAVTIGLALIIGGAGCLYLFFNRRDAAA